mmetsp:Transcript_52816/g.171877  ORF Transcript_52816/g.171877 Transcript_52816/m.171877 type:complete len:113 (-) Transcript_52816:411-749(-)
MLAECAAHAQQQPFLDFFDEAFFLLSLEEVFFFDALFDVVAGSTMLSTTAATASTWAASGAMWAAAMDIVGAAAMDIIGAAAGAMCEVNVAGAPMGNKTLSCSGVKPPTPEV